MKTLNYYYNGNTVAEQLEDARVLLNDRAEIEAQEFDVVLILADVEVMEEEVLLMGEVEFVEYRDYEGNYFKGIA